MRRVQCDETHSLPNPRQDTLDDRVSYFAVGSVAPPNQDVGIFENAGA